jgi:hypothetical protein
MDFVGLQDIGLVNPEIHPLWKDTTDYAHRIIGIAVTVRYVPTQQPPAGKRSEADFDKWVGDFYTQRTPSPSCRCCVKAASWSSKRRPRPTWVDRVQQHHGVEAQGCGGRHHQQHLSRHRRDHHATRAALSQARSAAEFVRAAMKWNP